MLGFFAASSELPLLVTNPKAHNVYNNHLWKLDISLVLAMTASPLFELIYNTHVQSFSIIRKDTHIIRCLRR
jgi:hypothetical protein